MTMLVDDARVTDLAPLRFVRSITAPLSPLQARRFKDKFGISVLNGYGQTELGGEIVGWSAADSRAYGDTKLGAVGRPHQGVVVRPVDANGADVEPGEAGELWVRTPAMAAGPTPPAGDLADRVVDGWFRTGDVGRVDPEGFVWIEGRVSDMINRGGLKVFPARGRRGAAAGARRRRRRRRRGARRASRRGPVGLRRARGPRRGRRARGARPSVPRAPRSLQGAGALRGGRRVAPQRDRQGARRRARHPCPRAASGS